jgi:hypothetical protein
VTAHEHAWSPASEIGCARYWCECGAIGCRDDAGRIVVHVAWRTDSDFDPPDRVVIRSTKRRPSLEDYDRRIP